MESLNGEVMIGLLEKCSKCRSHLTASNLELHKSKCWENNKILGDDDDNSKVPMMLNSKSPKAPSSPTSITKKSYVHDECDAIGELMGKYGKYQFIMTFLLTLFQIPNTFHIASSIYQSAEKNFWCSRPLHLRQLSIEEWRNISSSVDNCNILNVNWSLVTPENSLNLSNNNISKIKCTSWEYDRKDELGNTWTSEWNLVCDREYLRNVAEMFFLFGVATGGIISGYLSDKFGRRKMLFISVLFQTIIGFALYFIKSLKIYLVLRGLLGLMSVAVTYAGLILAIEFVDGKWRTIAGMYNLFPLPVCYMIISGIAFLTQDYQNLQLCIGFPGIFLCLLWFIIPESPRWLLCKGRVAEVKLIIKKAAEMNKLTLPNNLDKMLRPPLQDEKGCLNLFQSRYLRLITFCFFVIWFSMNMVYYGLLLNMNAFGGSVYFNSALAGLVEIPAIGLAITVIMKFGKKWIFCITLFCSCVACFAMACIEGSDDLQWLKITFLMIGKFTISAGNSVMPVFTAELYPTSIRNAGVGACNVAAGVALTVVPYLSLLTKIQPYLLMSVLTICSLLGGIVVIFLPESMPKYIDENEEEK